MHHPGKNPGLRIENGWSFFKNVVRLGKIRLGKIKFYSKAVTATSTAIVHIFFQKSSHMIFLRSPQPPFFPGLRGPLRVKMSI